MSLGAEADGNPATGRASQESVDVGGIRAFSTTEDDNGPAHEAQRRDEAAARLRLTQLHLDNFEQDIAQRKEFSSKLFKFMVGWLSCCLGLLFLSGAKSPSLSYYFQFELSQDVQLALLGSTTASIVGLVWIVAKYLFDRNKTWPPTT